jgi:hypothetical protein
VVFSLRFRAPDVEKVAAAIEADTGMTLPDLRQALAEAITELGHNTALAQLLARNHIGNSLDESMGGKHADANLKTDGYGRS